MKANLLKVYSDDAITSIYVYFLMVFLCITAVSLYLSFTIVLYPYNYILFTLFILIMLVGFINGILPSLLTALFVIFSYGMYMMYKLYIISTIADITFNDLFWIFVFPVAALISGMVGQRLNRILQENEKFSLQQGTMVSVDEITGFTNYRQFKAELDVEVARSIRYEHSMSLLLIEVAYFDEMKKEYNDDVVVGFIKQISDKISYTLRDVDTKAYLEEGFFATILTETPAEGVQDVISRLNEQINTLDFVVGRSTKQIKVKLKYSYASCPTDTKDAQELFHKAKGGLVYFVG